MKNKDGDFSIVFASTSWHFAGVDGLKELKIKATKNMIFFESEVQTNDSIGARIYIGQSDSPNSEIYEGTMYQVTAGQAMGTGMTGGGLFKLLPKKG